MKTNKGFSLVELIVVIAIMAIIAGVAIPVYTQYVDRTNKAADEQLFADIQDALTYALVADTSDNYTVTSGAKLMGAIVLSEDGIVVNDAVGGTLFDDALKKAFGAEYATEFKLAYDEWDASEIANADDIADSIFFSGTTSEKVGEVLSTVQGLTNALGSAMKSESLINGIGGTGYSEYLAQHGITDYANQSKELGNAAAFYVSEQVSGLTEDQKTAIINIWKTNQFAQETLQTPTDMMGVYGRTETGLSAMSALAVFYGNAYAMVNYVNDEGFSEIFFSGTEELSNATGLGSAWSIMHSVLIEMHTYSLQNGLQPTVNAYCVASGEVDAKAFVATLEQADEVSDEFTSDFSKDNMYNSTDMNDYIGGYVDSLKGFADLGISVDAYDSSVVISVIKNAEGKISFITFC